MQGRLLGRDGCGRGCRPGRVGSGLHQGLQSQMHEAGTVSGCPGLTSAGLERRLLGELAARAGAGARLGAGPLDGGGGELQRGSDLVGLDLDHGALVALRGLPGPQAQPADHDGSGAFAEGLGDVLGSCRQQLMRKKLVSPSVQVSPWRTRGVTARRKLATAAPLAVKRSSGSSVRLPIRVTVLSVAMTSPPGARGALASLRLLL